MPSTRLASVVVCLVLSFGAHALVGDVGRDNSPFALRYDTSHPAADAEGMVKMSNVSPILEMANMREASRSYEANLNLYEAGRKMRGLMIDLLK